VAYRSVSVPMTLNDLEKRHAKGQDIFGRSPKLRSYRLTWNDRNW